VQEARNNDKPDTGDEASDDTVTERNYRLYIAGSRHTSPNMLTYARRVVATAIERGWTIVVGDNHQGIDSEVVREASRLGYEDVIVVGIAGEPRNGGVSDGTYIRYGTTYADRDRAMARASDRGLFIWNGRSRGTRDAHAYMKARNKTVHLMDFSDTFATI
jgi:predicted Rossmann-fold nucleotide-binding protein